MPPPVRKLVIRLSGDVPDPLIPVLVESATFLEVEGTTYQGRWYPRPPTRWEIRIHHTPAHKLYSVTTVNLDIPGLIMNCATEIRSLATARDRAEQLARTLSERRFDGRWIVRLGDGIPTEPEDCWRRHAVRAVGD